MCFVGGWDFLGGGGGEPTGGGGGGAPSSTGGSGGDRDGTKRKGRALTPSSRSWPGSCGKKGTQDYSGMKWPPVRNSSP
jgi:hypothetical protein